jgi:hypothetical protein
VEIHRSARRHGVSDDDIEHALANGLVYVELEPDSDPPKFLCIGPSRAGTLLEVIWLDLADERMLVIHAMTLRPIYYDLLTDEDEST